jgi:hypothetical protein
MSKTLEVGKLLSLPRGEVQGRVARELLKRLEFWSIVSNNAEGLFVVAQDEFT